MMKSYSYISGGESKPEATQHNILEQSDIQSISATQHNILDHLLSDADII